MTTALDDLLFLGARLSTTATLLESLLGPMAPGRTAELVDLLRLRGAALASALEVEREGPQLLAALELGRRASLPLPGRSVEVRGPPEAAALASRLWTATEPGPTALILDVNRSLARLRRFREGRDALQQSLAAGAEALVVVAPSEWPVEEAWALSGGCEAVGLELVDCVWSGPAGLVSAARTSAVPVAGWPTSPS